MIDTLLSAWSQLHFLRPSALLVCMFAPLWWWRGWAAAAARLDDRVDPALRDAVLVRESVGSGWRRRAWLSAVTLLAGLALAGPAWREENVSIYQMQAPLVLAVDLSGHMLANDLEPDRLTRVRYKLLSLLRKRQGGQVALIAYAGDAFTVAPMTDDGNTVASLLDALSPRLMPVAGQNAAVALRRAGRLIQDAGFVRGEVLLATDAVDAAAITQAASLRKAGMRVSVLGIGTPDGAPLRGADGALVNDADGKPQWARLVPDRLAALAAAGGGGWQILTGDDSDLERLGLLQPDDRAGDATTARGELKRYRDEGVWLLPPLLLLLAFGFRRGGLLVLALAAIGLPSGPAQALDWDALWHNREQRADAASAAGDFQAAQGLSRDPRRIGAAAYRAGDWQAAIDAYRRLDDADAHYNRGNALARAGQLDAALRAYDEALARDPGMVDAQHNRDIVEQARQQQTPKPSSDQGHSDQQRGKGSGDRQSAQQDQQSRDGGADEPKPGESEQGQDDSSQEGQRQQGESGQQSDSEAGGDESSRGDEPGSDSSPGDPSGERQQKDAQAGQDGNGVDADGKPPEPADDRAAQAMREAIDQAIDQTSAGDAQSDAGEPGGKQKVTAGLDPAEQAEQEQRQAVEMQLRRIPDDPGGLLRQKFWLEYQRRQQEGEDE